MSTNTQALPGQPKKPFLKVDFSHRLDRTGSGGSFESQFIESMDIALERVQASLLALQSIFEHDDPGLDSHQIARFVGNIMADAKDAEAILEGFREQTNEHKEGAA